MKLGTGKFTHKLISLAAVSLPLTVLFLASCGGGGGGSSPVGYAGALFSNGQAASVVVGEPDFMTSTGGRAANLMQTNSYAPVFVDGSGKLYVPDELNNRTLVFNSIPASNYASANFAIGQIAGTNNLTSSANGVTDTAVYNPEQLVIAGGKLIQVDYQNNRVNIYTTIPTSTTTAPGIINNVVGQPDKTSNAASCGTSSLDGPESVAVVGTKLFIVDSINNRVLIWDSIPTSDGAPANHVLGQPDLISCAASPAANNTMNQPAGIWTDGTRLAVVDVGNSRVLIWNSIPTTDDQAADLVLGQADFSGSLANRSMTLGAPPTANTLNTPYDGVFFNSTQFFVADSNNNRVLVWNSFPTSNGQPADVVLGQTSFISDTGGTTARTMAGPTGVFLHDKQLFVSDANNARILIFNGN